MRNAWWRPDVVSLAVTAVLGAGCFSAPEPPPSEKTCESNCDRQAKLGCAQTPANFAEDCKQACLTYRLAYSDCVPEMNTMSGCVSHKVTYRCEPSGRISADPVAICENEEYACYGCTGEFAACRN